MSKKSHKQHEYAIRRAKDRHRRALKRKHIKYTPDFDVQKFSAKPSPVDTRVTLTAPSNFSILENRDEVIEYFSHIKSNIDQKSPTIMDMSKIQKTDFATICFLIATMMDQRESVRSLFKYLFVRIPGRNSPMAQLFDQAQFKATVTKRGIADHNYFLSRLDTSINKEYSLDILNRSEKFFRQNTDLSTLWPILTEIITNTNNHADPDRGREPNQVPWFAGVLEIPENDKICYCVVDLGIGIYESLNQKGIKQVQSGRLSLSRLKTMFNTSQSNLLSTSIPRGVESSTKKLYRGQGLKDIYSNADKGPYNRFEILTNKAKVDITNISHIYNDSEYNLEGTIFYWEIYAG